MLGLAAGILAPAPVRARVPPSSRTRLEKRTRGVSFPRPYVARTTCRAGGEFPPDRRRGRESYDRPYASSRDDAYDERYDARDGPRDDPGVSRRDDAFRVEENRLWREAQTSRTASKKAQWNAWDASAEEENARRASAAAEKRRRRRMTPDQRRASLDTHKQMSRAADEAFTGKILRRRDAGWEGSRFPEDPNAAPNESSRNRSEFRSPNSLVDWLFAPLTRTARGVNEWLTEDIAETRGRGYAPEVEPGRLPQRRFDAAFERSAFPSASSRGDARRGDARRGDAGSFASNDAYDFQPRDSRFDQSPPRSSLRGKAYDGGRGYEEKRTPFGAGAGAGSRPDARERFRNASRAVSEDAEKDIFIDAREFERLKNRR